MRKELRDTLSEGRFHSVPVARTEVMRSIRGTRNRSTETKLRMGMVRAGLAGWQIRPPWGRWKS